MRVLCLLALFAACGDDGATNGLDRVDYGSYARTPSDGTELFAALAETRELTSVQRARYGGTGPMTREPDHNLDQMCRKAPR